MKKLSLTLLVVCAISGCAFTAPRYGASASNVENLRTAVSGKGAKIAVGTFTSFEPGMTSIVCRGAGPVTPPDGVTYEKFIEQSIVSELRFADAYSESSPKRLEGRLDYANFNSNIGFGKWEINVTFQGNGVAPFTINSVYPFSTNFVGGIACNQVATALPAAVQDLVGKLTVHPSFKEFVERKD